MIHVVGNPAPPHASHDSDLALKSSVHPILREHLQRNWLAHLQIPGSVDDAHAPPSRLDTDDVSILDNGVSLQRMHDCLILVQAPFDH